MKKTILVLAMLFSIAIFGQTKVKVVGVLDGDTYYCQNLKKTETFVVRLANVDCPEVANKHTGKSAQPFGLDVKITIKGLLLNQIIAIKVIKTDKYFRKIAMVKMPNGKDLATYLIKNGYAWCYFDYQKDRTDEPKFLRYQQKAQLNKLGLFAEENPTPPWIYRKKQ